MPASQPPDVLKGILDAEDKSDFKVRLSAAQETLDEEERRLTGNQTPLFWKYLNSHKQMMKKCMIAPARKKAGMPLDKSGTPLRSYSNQSESINNKLTRQKEGMVKNDKSKVNMTKLQFTRDVFEEVDKHQQHELQLATCGLSNEYELADVVAHLAIPTEDWFDMSEYQRKDYILKFNRMTVEDAIAGKTIAVSTVSVAEPTEFKEFSVDVKASLQSFTGCTAGLVATIVEGAETLLNCKDAIQRVPSLASVSQAKYLVAANNCKRRMYDCTVYSDHATCTCPCYKYNRLCKHSLCVAEISGILKEHLGYLARTSRSIPSRSGLVEPLKQAQGKKGGNHKNTWRPNRTSTGTTEASARLSHSHPFSEIHHNNIPLVVCFLRDETKATECRQCRMAFPRRQKIVPYNIVLSHEERWMYPAQGIKLPSAKYTKKFYCVKRSCITKRFPYFHPSFIEIPEEVKVDLRDSHLEILREELDYTT